MGQLGLGKPDKKRIFFIQREMKLVKRKEHRITNGARGKGAWSEVDVNAGNNQVRMEDCL